MSFAKLFLILLVAVIATDAKIYQRCELARELRNRYGIPANELSKWICIAHHESSFNTRAINRQSGDYGLFQINHRWWCSPPGTGCGRPCSAFVDDNIADDVACAKKIKNVQGFKAWVAYNHYCTGNTAGYLSGCF